MTTEHILEQKLRLETLLNDLSVRQQASSANPVMAEVPGPARGAPPPNSLGSVERRDAGPPSSSKE
jgi:hypothetical protein